MKPAPRRRSCSTRRMSGRWSYALFALVVMTGGACKNKQTLGPADAYVLLAPKQPPQKSPGGTPIVEKLDFDEGPAVAVNRLLGDGFAVEMVRTVHLAKQLARGPGFERCRSSRPTWCRRRASRWRWWWAGTASSRTRTAWRSMGWWARPEERPHLALDRPARHAGGRQGAGADAERAAGRPRRQLGGQHRQRSVGAQRAPIARC